VDKVRINNMKFFAYHCLAPEEKSIGQTFEVDIEVSTSLIDAGKTDDLNASIDYSALYAIANEEMHREKFDLIEMVAENISIRILALKGACSTTIRIRKPNAPLDGIFDHVEIEITRERS